MASSLLFVLGRHRTGDACAMDRYGEGEALAGIIVCSTNQSDHLRTR